MVKQMRSQFMKRFMTAIILVLCAFLSACSVGTETIASAANITYYPQCTSSYSSLGSLVDALNSIHVSTDFASRQKIAAANNIINYTGTASQNIQMLKLLKNGRLIMADDVPVMIPTADKIKHITQDQKTCKATAVAMAVNLLRGTNVCTTASMGGSYCNSIENVVYTGYDGNKYRGVYKTDSYIGSPKELTDAVNSAISRGVPIVVAVHSIYGGSKHHWIVIVGQSTTGYLATDPWSGSAWSVGENAQTLSAMGYAFGLTDYAVTHYGYVTFS